MKLLALPRWLLRALCAAWLLLSLPALAMEIHLGVLSFRPKEQAQHQWQPLADYLNQRIPGHRFTLTVYHYPDMLEAVRQHAVDVLVTQPAEYVRMVHENGLSAPLATLIPWEEGQAVRVMGGVILTRANRLDLSQLQDLRGARIATPSLRSFGAYQIQAGELARAGVRPAAVVETGMPQDRTIEALLAGEVDAAFVRTGLVESLVREGKLDAAAIKVLNPQRYPGYPYLLSTRLYPEWPVVAMPHLSEHIAVQVAGALLSIPHGSETARRMGLYGFSTPADYEPVRALMREMRLPPFDQAPPVRWIDVWQQHHAIILGAVALALLLLAMAVRESWLRQRMNTISKAMGEGLFVLDHRGRVSYINPAACRLLGHPREALLGRELPPLIIAPEQPNSAATALLQRQRWQQAFEGEAVFVSASGKHFPVALTSRPVWRQGRFLRSVTVFSDISERKAQSEHIYQLAYHDALTGLPNRRLLQQRLQERLARHDPGQRGALLFTDLDRFKQLNDTLGHRIGDALLQAAAGRMVRLVGTRGWVARTGGDEFAILLDGLDADATLASEQASALAQEVRRGMAEPFGIDRQYHRLTLSIGVALFDGPLTGADELLKRADLAMYEAKARGRNAVCFYDQGVAQHLQDRVALEADLHVALAQQQLHAHYQPQVDAAGRCIALEALLRWQHPVRGLVPPAQFIPLAEESGLILPVGQWMLEQVCQQIRQWHGDPQFGRLVISVNLSVQQIMQANFVESVTAVLMASGANPQRLQLELTESVLAHDIEEVSEKMRRLVALGVQFSLDDFGTGYSSLSYLKRLPIQQLKIDASFVRDLQSDPQAVAIARTIVALGHSLGLEVIAEGVETEAQRDILLAQGCRFFQGYLFGRPQPLAALRAQLHGAAAAQPEPPPD
jgi:diguanylate cyclase (GGDEF)-like protein/PAS domain S-box-containing protein